MSNLCRDFVSTELSPTPPELKSGAVVSVMDDWMLPPISLSAVYPTGRLASSKARQFTAFVEGCLEPEFAPESMSGHGRPKAA